MSEARRITDPEALKAFAHPMRLRLYQLLRRGPATVGGLAKQVDGDPGQVSYHLRELAKHGFIAEAPELSRDLRQTWWRPVPEAVSWSSTDFDSAAGRQLVDTVKAHWVREQFRSVRAAEEAKFDWDPQWRDGASAGQSFLRLSSRELAELSAELLAVLERFYPLSEANRKSADPNDHKDVRVFYHAFPEESR